MSRARATPWVAMAALAVAGIGSEPVEGQETHLLVVVGLGGSDEHRARFHGWAAQLIDAATQEYGVPASNVRVLSGQPDLYPELVDGRSTAAEIEAAVNAIAATSSPDDDVLIVVIGHGSLQGGRQRINLPGPDVGPEQFALYLDSLGPRRVAFVNGASASGGFADALAAPDRTVITATRTAREQNETVFPGFFVEAFEGETADLDKNGRVSLLEAFEYATHEVERHYEDEGLLQTEHARLVDDWSRAEDEVSDTPLVEARLAASFYLGRGAPPAVAADASPELLGLYARRDSLEARIAELRAVREALDADEYEQRLEELLVEMALVTRSIDRLEGGS